MKTIYFYHYCAKSSSSYLCDGLLESDQQVSVENWDSFRQKIADSFSPAIRKTDFAVLSFAFLGKREVP